MILSKRLYRRLRKVKLGRKGLKCVHSSASKKTLKELYGAFFTQVSAWFYNIEVKFYKIPNLKSLQHCTSNTRAFNKSCGSWYISQTIIVN